MELKKHYKMYKSGKMWVSAAVATLALTAGMTVSTNVSADESTNANQTQATTNQNANSSSNEVNLSQAGSTSNATTPAQPADNQNSNAGKADDQNSQSSEVKTATVTRNITFTAVDDQGKEVSLPNGAKSKDQQNVTISTGKDGKWQSTDMPEYQISQVDGYYTKVNGKWETTIPTVSITDPNQKI